MLIHKNPLIKTRSSSIGQKQNQCSHHHISFILVGYVDHSGSGRDHQTGVLAYAMMGCGQQPYLHHLVVQALHSYVKGRHHAAVPEVWVSSFTKKKLHTFNLVFFCSPVQRGISIIIHDVQH